MGDYSGHVAPGGSWAARTVDADGIQVEVRKLSVGPLDNNAYLLRDVASGRALLIDAANEPPRLLDMIGGASVETILTTHGHGDHWQALAHVAGVTGARTVLHPGDAPMVPRAADIDAEDGMVLQIGGASVLVLHTPGHTPGSTCVLLGGLHLFTGDTLFPGGTGRVGSPKEFEQIIRSVTEKLFDKLGDDCWVYPGHGDDTTLGAERPHLPEWRARGW